MCPDLAAGLPQAPKDEQYNNNICSSLHVLPSWSYEKVVKIDHPLFLAILMLVITVRAVLAGSLVVMIRTTCSQLILG